MKGSRTLVSAVVLAFAVLVLGAHPTWAQRMDESGSGQNAQAGKTAQAMGSSEQGTFQFVEAKATIGSPVDNPSGERLGTVKDILVDLDRNDVVYVALESTGSMGAAKYYAIPWSAFQFGHNNELVLDVSKQQLEQAPGFSQDNWPQHANPRWMKSNAGSESSQSSGPSSSPSSPQSMSSSGGQSSMASGGSQSSTSSGSDQSSMASGSGHSMMPSSRDRTYRLGNIFGDAVDNPEQKRIGDVRDVLIDFRTSDLAYAIVAYGGVLGIGEHTAAVPFAALNVEPQQGIAVLSPAPPTLDKYTVSPSDDYAQLKNRQYASEIYKAFGVTPFWQQKQASAERTQMGDPMMGDAGHGMLAPNQGEKSMTTIHGTVENVETYALPGVKTQGNEGLRLEVRTNQGRSVLVDAGLEQQARRQQIEFAKGDEIEATGRMQEMRSGQMELVATKIQKGSKTLMVEQPSSSGSEQQSKGD